MYTSILLAGLAAVASTVSASPFPAYNVSATPFPTHNVSATPIPTHNISASSPFPTHNVSATPFPTHNISANSFPAYNVSATPFPTRIISSSSTTATQSATAVVPNPAISTSLLAQVELASTVVDRFKILAAADPTHLKFDFNPAANPPAPNATIPDGGQVILANVAKFPALVDLGISSAVGFMNPCGLNTPHIHPRATEFLTVIDGANVKTGFILENGLTTQMSTTLNKFQGTVFPQGSIHFQFNDNCAPATFVAGLNSEDPGASQIAQNFFALDADVVVATLGFPKNIDATNIVEFRKAIPAPFAKGVEECLKRCHIAY